MAKGVTVASRTGPSPSSGKRMSFEPMRKEPPINGLQRRAIVVTQGMIAAASDALAGSPARRPTQQRGLPSVMTNHSRLLLLLFFPKRRFALGFHQRQNFLARDHATA